MGLTGGIGAGKSTVAAVLARAGATVIDADAIAREVVEPGTPGLAELAAEFGKSILSPDGTLDRPALAAVAFADESSRLRLNAILHPRIGARTQERIDAAPAGSIVVQDIPLLVEGSMGPLFHVVVVVDADEDTRVSRLVGSRGLDESDARARIAAQATGEQRRAVADVWLDNSGPAGALDHAVEQLWEHRLVPFARNLAAGDTARPDPKAAVAANADGAAGAARRLAQRLRVVLGADAAEVESRGADAGVEATVRPAAGATADSMAARMPGAGLVRAGASRFRSADPGAAAMVDVVG
ncbi:dephospho-CoA kinase [Tomitella fengzijianii]|uniref:dephospho-CoA kinase n=1 Tax=Tomitella fengzijianii TaxID=2597660 RepID=UPI0027E469E0|nr:dephospho-CoA kinase [Tomitella fengzijianii]